MKKILFLLVVLNCLPLFSQDKKVSIVWNSPQTFAADSYKLTLPSFSPSKNFSFDLDKGIQFVEQWKTNGLVNENSLIISNPVFVSISKSDLKSLNVNTIPASINATLKNAIARDVKYAVLTLSPIIKVGSTYKKLVSFNYSYNTNGISNRISNIQTITNSVLSTGSWYKFEVERSGVFKISKSFLNQMGINADAVDPRTIKIFGNGGKMMPFANNANFPFDPTENAIKVIGEDDGVFNNEDYILFYAQGPTADVDVSYINTNINPYSNKTVYYINISSGLGKRIQNFIQPTTAATLVVDTFQDYKFHEVDETNIIFVGRRWFGENFSVESTQSFNFDFPNLVTSEPINIKVFTATTSSNATSFGISVNTNSIGNIALSQTNSADGVYVTGGTFQDNTLVTSDDVNVTLDYNNQGNPSATAYLDYIGIEATRSLTFNGNQFHFKNQSTTVNTTGVANYNLSNAAQVQEVWDVTNIYDVGTIPNTNQDNVLSFNAPMGDLKTFVTVSSQNYFQPILSQNSRVNNINLKGTIFQNAQGVFQDIDYLMLTTRSHLGQAQRLAQINRDKKNLNVKVVILDEIYTEFSSGNPDIAGIRNFVKYVYDNASTPENRVKYLCIFGDSSFDYKGRIASNTYNFPTWNAYSSFNLSSSFISDDFYAYVDDNEGTLDVFNNANKLDIAVGRVLADTPLRASQMVDKVETYYSKEALGSWRNNFVVVSDDVDEAWEATLQETTDEIGDEVTAFKPFINVTKIHSDSYQQEASAGGDRYPEVKEAMTNAIERGAIMVNYFGHGGEDGLAFERIFQNTDAEALNNDCKLNLFVTVTCEFTRFDNPLRITAGEFIYWNKDAGSIGLITTTRQIFVTVGKDFNKILKEYLFSYSTNDTYSDYEYPSIAEALRLAKNDPDFSNAQKSLAFYIGDPALQLAFPQPDIRLTKVNDVSVTQETDVLQALSYAKLEGVVTDVNGNTLTDYNGVLTTTIYDKQIERETLANDNTTDANGIIKLNYTTLGAIVFRGQATVTNGQWEIDFIVPKDIGIPVGTGKVSFYATQENSLEDKTGASVETLKIGGINPNAAEDNIGPTIQLYMNDEAFVSGGITNESPLLLAKFEDDNGINTASGIGHDIVAILDGDEVNPYVLNDYYLTDVDDYTKGSLDFPFRDLEPGLHTLNLKAWDVYNNSATAEIQFVVYNENESLVINNVLNYPNPFVNYTEFWFSHNSSEVLDISVQIFTVSGKLVRTLNGQTALAGGKNIKSTSRDIVWDGRDDFGDKIGKGTYIYKLKVHSQSTNKTVEKIEKLVIL